MEEEDGREAYDAADSADSYERDAAAETLAQKLAKRKRAASFLHQLLLTVRTRGERRDQFAVSLRWQH